MLFCLSLHLFDPFARSHGEAQTLAALKVALCHTARQIADASDVSGAFSDADGTTRVEKVETMRCLKYLLVSWLSEL